MCTAFYYTKATNETEETVKYLAKKYCLKLDYVYDLRQMILKGSDLTRYSLIVDTTTTEISDDLINYMINYGGNPKLAGIILIANAEYKCKFEDNYRIFVVRLGDSFGAELVDKAFKIKDNFYTKVISDNLSDKIDDTLLSARITPKYLGYSYIKDAIIYCISGSGNIEKLSNIVYPYIATKNATKATSVERNIRIAIDSAWRGENKAFGFETKPSNKALIAYVINEIKRTINK